MSVDWASIGVMVAIGALLWRQIAALGARVDALSLVVADVDRRLARLEGWIEGERVGRGRAAVGTGKGSEVVHG